MCGICGIVSNDKIERDRLQRMANAISHRGPDDEGFYLKNGIGLGHRRLSIIDLDGGRQPLTNEDQTIWIVFNGEIYNYKSLRKELQANGHKFSTDTDTEVIIHLYEDLGVNCVDRLNGMFAFAIWDERSNKLFMARDRIGQKPLFYATNGRKFIFASEVKGILAEGSVNREIDFSAVHHYLSLRFIPAPQSMFMDIKKVPAGHYLTYHNGNIEIERYWDLYFSKKLKLKEEEYLECLDEQLMKTVESHLVSDVPVGSFLSGGMDTSMVVAMMGHILKNSFKTFSIGVKEQDYNELPYARIVSSRYGTEHIERIVSANLIQMSPKMIWFLDEPSDPIAACMFQAAKLASEHVKVVLGGDGGDELFAGFDRYAGMRLIDYYNFVPALVRNNLIAPIVNKIPDSFTYKSMPQKLRWMHRLSGFNEGERYAEATSFFRFNHQEKESLFQQHIWNKLKDKYSNKIIIEQYDKHNAEDPIDKMLYADFMTRLAEHTLMLTDRMNMAHGVEARSPYLDHPLVELLATFPSNIKISNRKLKYILKRLGKNYLPDDIVRREKQGFMFPVAYWFKDELYKFLKLFFNNSQLINEDILKKEKVFGLIEEHRRSKVDNHVRIWMLLNIEIWYKLYIKQQTIESLEQEISDNLKRAM